MALADIIRNGVATVNKAVSNLEVPVTRRAWIGEAKKGDGDYSAPYDEPDTFRAIVETDAQLIQSDSGQLVMSVAHITILTPITANGAEGRKEPIDPRDRFTLPDGTTGPIVRVSGFTDSKTNLPFFCEIWLGAS